MKIYTSGNIHTLPCKETPAIRFAKKLLLDSSFDFVENASGQFFLIANEEGAIPCFISSNQQSQTYTCSLKTHYIHYPKRELELLRLAWLKPLLFPLFLCWEWLLHMSKSEDAIYIDNWLVATNLHEDWLTENLEEVINLLRREYPSRTLILRSANELHSHQLIEKAQHLGAFKIFSRKIYDFHSNEPDFKLSSDLKKDLKLFNQKAVSVERLKSNDVDQIDVAVNFYNQLYLDKYSKYNPQFSPKFISNAIEAEFLQVYVFIKENEVFAILGFYQIGGIITAPLLGIDYNNPASKIAYRTLTAYLSKTAMENNLRINRSAGADEFKLNRNSIAEKEYSLIWSKSPFLKVFAGFVTQVSKLI